VRFEGRRIPVRVSERTGLVHAVAAFALASARERVLQLERRADPAAGVRSLALDAAARVLGVESSRLAIERADRVPILLLDGIPAPLVVSLSHHGRFAACALGPPAFGAWA
jgi:hypothetical protein